MRSRSDHFALVLFAVALGVGSARAETPFGSRPLPKLADTPVVEINLDGALLSFLEAAGDDDTEAPLLRGIEGIRVRAYEDLSDPDAVLKYIDDASGALETAGWRRAVFIRDEGARVHVYLKSEGDRVAGLSVMISGEAEALFLDLAGTIDPTTLGSITRSMGLDEALDGLGGEILKSLPAAHAAEDAEAGADE